jgi:hypothetical protein
MGRDSLPLTQQHMAQILDEHALFREGALELAQSRNRPTTAAEHITIFHKRLHRTPLLLGRKS